MLATFSHQSSVDNRLRMKYLCIESDQLDSGYGQYRQESLKNLLYSLVAELIGKTRNCLDEIVVMEMAPFLYLLKYRLMPSFGSSMHIFEPQCITSLSGCLWVP